MLSFYARLPAMALVVAGALLAVPALAERKMKVLTTFTIISDMAANVAGDAAEVVSITRPGAEIHGYQPTPQDMVRAAGADLVLWNGLNLELWFEPFLAHVGEVPSVVVTEGIDPIPMSRGPYGGQPNPHAWMGVDTALIYIDNIAKAFATHDPANAQVYANNAARYKTALEATMGPLRASLAALDEDRRWLVSCEGAFSYLARDLGLKELYLWPMNAEQIGTPQQLRHVIDSVRANNIPVVFCESTLNPAPAQQVARETGARFGGVLYVDSLSHADGPVPTYLDLLRTTTQTIAQGLMQHQTH